jgi:PTS system nitrogen regulatory IIA component
MMIVDILSEDLIIPNLKARTRDDVLAELVERIVKHTNDVDGKHALTVLIERERIGSTGIGHGIAIPHAKLPKLQRAIACFARSREGVEFGSLDGRPAHLFLTLLAPERGAGLHLKALARASRLFKDADFRERLLESDDTQKLWSVIYEKDTQLSSN